MSWAKIKGVFVHSRKNLARVIAALSAAILAFHTAAAPLSTDDESLCRRTSAAMCRLLPIEDSMPPGAARIAVNDCMFQEVAELFLRFRHLVPGGRSPRPGESPPRVLAPTVRKAAKAADRRGRRGSGLKGNRTLRMVEQLSAFKTWLRDNPVNENNPAKTIGARANAFWHLRGKTMEKDANRTGEKRGFSSPKPLASAYRNSKA